MALSPYEQFRRALRDLNILAQQDIDLLWRSTGGDPAALMEILPEVVDTYGSAASSLSADWYDEMRADSGVRGSYTAFVPEPGDPGTAALVGWAQSRATSPEAFQALILGGLQRRITNFARDVVTDNAIRDTAATGWMRIGHGECAFCAMLISRGAVYTERSVKFHSHDDCNCGAAPAFNPDQISEIRGEFVPSARRRAESTKDADNQRARDWITTNL